MKQKFDIEGMFCSACVNHVHKAVTKLNGIISVNVNLVNNSMIVIYDEGIVNNHEIIESVKNAGYKASIYDSKKKLVNEKDLKNKKIKLIISLCLMIILMYVSMGKMLNIWVPFNNDALYNGILQLVLLIPICILNFFFFKDGYNKIFKLNPNMSSLIAIASTGSIIYGLYGLILLIIAKVNGEVVSYDLYFESAGTILSLVSLGKYIEFRSKAKTTKAVSELMNLVPPTAVRIVLENDIEKYEEIYIEEINKDDVLLVKTGEYIPVDGVIVDGKADIDESMITGESIPVYKNVGNEVISSTILVDGNIRIKTTSTANDSTIAKIINIVDEASNSKAQISRLADKVSMIFVPSVIGIALLAFVLWFVFSKNFEYSFRIGISVLVVSCPCALGLATPLAIMISTGFSAYKGILFKSAVALENVHNINKVFIDKTGTITSGKLRIENIKVFDEEEKDIKKIVASIERQSNHPIAKSIMDDYANNDFYNINNFENIIGEGLKATIGDDTYLVGNRKILENNNIEYALDNSIYTSIYVCKNSKHIATYNLIDEIKENSKNAIKELNEKSIQTCMISGDGKDVCEYVGKCVGINEIYSEVSPIQKGEIIDNSLKGNFVGMVGDGINDAIALSKVNIGIAIGAGTDVAISSANVILMKNDLSDVNKAIEISKKTIANIKLSLFWAFFYNALCIPIACGALSFINIVFNPMIAALAMSLSSICVVLNALRLNISLKKIYQ